MLLKMIVMLSAVASTICVTEEAFAAIPWLLVAIVSFVLCGVILIALAFAFLCIACSLVDMNKEETKDSPFYRTLAYLYIEAVLPLAGIRMDVKGLENTPKEGRFLLVCNHQNEADPGVLMHFFRKSHLIFISKRENANMFIVGRVMHKIQCQLLNRENDREALKTILKCIQIIKEDRASVAVFPEGGIKGDRELHPFRPGVFKIAQKTQVPIVVCTIRGTTDLFRNIKKLKTTPVQLRLMDVIQPEQYRDLSTVELGKMIYDIMAKGLPDYRLIGYEEESGEP